jgi:hypothetical protein
MIVKEQYTRKDGVMLYRTYSDTDHLIKKVADGVIYGDAIDVAENEEYEEIDGYVELEGPESYDEIIKVTEEASVITRKINRIPLTNNEALSVKGLYPRWEDKIGTTIEVGFITLYGGNLWKARQTHTAMAIYPPSLDTAALYEVVVYQHEGTMEDPIPYTPPMEIFEGKYYKQNDVLYKCTRSSGIALSHDLQYLVGIYVEVVIIEDLNEEE